MENNIISLLTAALFIPLAAAVIVLFFGKNKLGNTKSAWFSVAAMASAFICAFTAYIQLRGMGTDTRLYHAINWLPTGNGNYLQLGAFVDSVTVTMFSMVTFIATLVLVYSIGYMDGDKKFTRFFSYLLFFTFSMLGIVLSNSLLQLFVFWELVGLASYLLIGFWNDEKEGPQLASKKAFVMNRVGDLGFIVGFGIFFAKLGGIVILPGAEGIMVDGSPIQSMLGALNHLLATESTAAGLTGDAVYTIANPPMWLTAAGIGLFFGAMGKSAQFPLHTWLPDAMEGPTPVSSIVHSATMVAAGVYLASRVFPVLTPGARLFITTIGLVTLIMPSLIAMCVTDIKKVLAYSTLSQLGYMIVAIGTGSYTFALFHLFTHAFFKCCLFQCSGSIILQAHHEQDMTQYGGFGKKMPMTMLAYGLATLSIAGVSIPFAHSLIGTDIAFSAFFSKDGIIAGSFNYSEAMTAAGYTYASIFAYGPVVIAYITPFYMMRTFALTFLGKPRNQEIYDHLHEAPKTMWVPQLILVFTSMVIGYVLVKDMIVPTQSEAIYGNAQNVAELESVVGHTGMHTTHVVLGYGLGSLASLFAGWFVYKDGFSIASKIVAIPGIKQLHTLAYNKFYFDQLFDNFAVWICKTFSSICGWVDAYLVDGLVKSTVSLTKGISLIVGNTDKHVVDGAVNLAASAAQNMGSVVKTTQAGRIRLYVLLMFAAAGLATAIVTILSIFYSA